MSEAVLVMLRGCVVGGFVAKYSSDGVWNFVKACTARPRTARTGTYGWKFHNR